MTTTNLKQLRQRHKLTQAEFWNRIGITQSSGSRYENDERRIPKPVQILLDIAYGSKWQKTVTALRSS